MYKICYPFLLTVVCIIGVGCIPLGTNVDTLQPANPDAKELQDYQHNMDQEQGSNMTSDEKQKTLMLAQDYQGALDLMPQVAKELLENAMKEKEKFEQGMLKREPICEALSKIRFTYVYLYLALGKDEEALQKLRDIELPAVADLEFAYMDSSIKILILKRLNMHEEVIEETNAILTNIGPALLGEGHILEHAHEMMGLIIAQIATGDLESAQNNIDQLRNYLRRWPMHISEVQHFHANCSEMLALAEHYINHLTETHTIRFAKGTLEPPTRCPDNPDNISFEIPPIAFGFFCNADGRPFTYDDLCEILAKSLPDPFPLLERDSTNENVETE